MQLRDLFEAREAPLFHFMDYEKSMDVFGRDAMHAYWKHTIPGMGDVKGNSFSRNARFGYPGRPVKLVVDQTKLAQTNKIVPLDGEMIFRGWGGIGKPRPGHADRVMNSRPGHSQLAEEFVVGDISRLHRCITHIELQNPNVYHMSGQEIMNLDEMVRAYAAKYEIPLSVHPNYEAKLEEIRQRWKEYEEGLDEAAPSAEMREQTFYHGVDSTDKAKFVMKNGLKGREVQGRAHLAPVVGRSYLAQDLSYAMMYALGGDLAGHKVPLRPGKDPYGYLFVLKGDGLEDVQPDEDSVGEFLYKHSEKGLFKGDPSNSDLTYVTWRWIRDSVTPNQRRAMMDGDYASWAQGGKRALKNMPDTLKKFLIKNGAHVAATGTLKPIEVWKIAKSKSELLKRDGSNFFEIAKRVK